LKKIGVEVEAEKFCLTFSFLRNVGIAEEKGDRRSGG
jgi:hypothetical protein